MKTFTVLSCDPGTKNFAAALVTGTLHDDGRLKFKIHGTHLMQSTVLKLTESIGFALRGFTDEIESLLNNQGLVPDALFMERFQSRGMGGTTIECINFMIGSLVSKYYEDTEIALLTAATWKNRANAKIDFKGSYTKYGLNRVASNKTPHELDAAMIGIYACYKHFELEPFTCFSPENFDRFMEYFQTVPTLKV